ncbi:putative hydrogenase expression/formation protein HypE [Aeropyrum pernix]|uniref:Putative hydrogenase expression/formation protein HypE n=1 Tax=Aeropyrum pernix TaxID=56636 RepID=A0A401H9V0_AERPX|nr:AIR synthase family protein [Aeropyrum pernix]GBF09174.1 putative hydrogenase expression/formation protein HypE [Aeropyrum pernix]
MHGKSGDWIGKLPLSNLARILQQAGRRRAGSTRVGPSVGEDAAIVSLGPIDLVMHLDPITEAGALAGWLAVHVAANDIAVTGARPRWEMLAVLMPPGSSEDSLASLLNDAVRAAEEIGVEIVGGHTEAAPGVPRPIIVAAAAGITCGGCTTPTSAARPGDLVLQVKPAAIEGTAIIATDFADMLRSRGVGEDAIAGARMLASRVSIVEEAIELAEAGVVRAMHDPTEGGVLGGLVEMALASRTVIEVDEDKIIVGEATRIVASALGIDPLRLISSGTLLATVPPDKAGEARYVLEELGVEYSFIGRVAARSGEPALRLSSRGRVKTFREPPMDEIARLHASKGPG